MLRAKMCSVATVDILNPRDEQRVGYEELQKLILMMSTCLKTLGWRLGFKGFCWGRGTDLLASGPYSSAFAS